MAAAELIQPNKIRIPWSLRGKVEIGPLQLEPESTGAAVVFRPGAQSLGAPAEFAHCCAGAERAAPAGVCRYAGHPRHWRSWKRSSSAHSASACTMLVPLASTIASASG